MSTTQQLLAQAGRLFRHNRQGSYKTRERYAEAFNRFCRFTGDEFRVQKLKNIAPKHVREYVTDMQRRGLSASTIKTDLAAIRFWHEQIPEAKNKLPTNAELNLELRSFGKVDRTWSEREFNLFLLICHNAGRNDYVTIASLARYVGLRIHECFRIDAAIAAQAVYSGTLTIKGKGGKIRTVPINDAVTARLNTILKVTPRGQKLFVPQGVPTDRAINAFQDFIRAHRDEFRDPDNDFPLTCHGLRHNYAVEQYVERAEQMPETAAKREVSTLLGHNRADVTNIYLASLRDKKGDADV